MNQADMIRTLKNLDGQPLRHDWCAACSLPVIQVAAVNPVGALSSHKSWVHDTDIGRSLARAVRLQLPPAHSCAPE